MGGRGEGSLGKLPPASRERQPGFSRMLSTEAAVTYLADESLMNMKRA